MGHPRQAPHGVATATNAGSQYRSRRRGRQHVCTHPRGRASADPSRGSDHVPGRPEDRHTVGQGREADFHTYARRAPPVQGDRSSRIARGNPAAAFGVTSGRIPGAVPAREACARSRAHGGGQAEAVQQGGVGPGGGSAASRGVVRTRRRAWRAKPGSIRPPRVNTL